MARGEDNWNKNDILKKDFKNKVNEFRNFLSLFDDNDEWYQIPYYYQSAVPFYDSHLLDFKQGRELLEKESYLFEKVQKKVPNKLGELLQNLYENKHFMLGIHRTPKSIEEIINSYFKKGLENKKLEYDNTISTYLYFPKLLDEILKCNSGWKASKGCLIVCIPRKPGTPFYRVAIENGQERYYVLPTFIYGYIGVENGKIKTFVYNANYGKELVICEEVVSDAYIERKSSLKLTK